MPLREITTGIYAIDGLNMGRSYLIEDKSGLTLIDTSTADAAGRILRAIEELGRQPEDLHTIVGTHYHFDHVGNVTALVQRTGATFAAHKDDVEYIEARTPWKKSSAPLVGGIMDSMAPDQVAIRVDRVLHDGDVVAAVGGLDVVHAPGHTPGHIALYAKERSTLFAGDAFFNSFGLQMPIAASSHDMDQAKVSIRRLSELQFEYALPGHGQPVLSRASEKLGEWSRRWL
jgi:glyoxylase-like metal-dependent hydrolase (beta-lactamase superfamily II)